jgi:hypothetical protein
MEEVLRVQTRRWPSDRGLSFLDDKSPSDKNGLSLEKNGLSSEYNGLNPVALECPVKPVDGYR